MTAPGTEGDVSSRFFCNETGVFLVRILGAAAGQSQIARWQTHPRPNMSFNDGRCDRQGRFWVSTMWALDMRTWRARAQVGSGVLLSG
ncbi:MAG: SMP-30/gluconolactonase/LRE family protein [Rhodoferax sp.]|nr:SMP-30/gluconolactonase/LRE family protein [Rhodoferax sp.]